MNKFGEIFCFSWCCSYTGEAIPEASTSVGRWPSSRCHMNIFGWFPLQQRGKKAASLWQCLLGLRDIMRTFFPVNFN